MAKYAAALDQGTTSTRCMVFDHARQRRGGAAAGARADLSRARLGRARPAGDLGSAPRRSSRGALGEAGASARRHRRRRHHQPARDDGGVGPQHRPAGPQRDRLAGHPHRRRSATSWPRDGGQDRFRAKTGLPLATYFSGPKVRWILDNVDGARDRAEAATCSSATIDTWLLWNLTGGPNGGLHVTDVTNASRTLLMDLATLAWDDELCGTIGVPRRCCRRSARRARCTARSRAARSPACRSPATSATSRRPPSARPASRSARRRTPTAPATSCC